MPVDYSTIDRARPMVFDGLGRRLGQTATVAPSAALKPCDTPDSEFDPQELALGTQHELEHTADPEMAKCIAKHHLVEEAQVKGVPLKSRRIRYYRDLARTEMRWRKIGQRKGTPR